MYTLTNIVVSLPDTIAIVATPKEMGWRSCPVATTDNDIAYLKVLGEIIINGIAIVAIAVILCVFMNLIFRYVANIKKQKLDIARMQEDIQLKKYIMAHDDNQRNIEHGWKIEYDNTWKEKDNEHKLAEKNLDLKIKEAERTCKEAEQKETSSQKTKS